MVSETECSFSAADARLLSESVKVDTMTVYAEAVDKIKEAASQGRRFAYYVDEHDQGLAPIVRKWLEGQGYIVEHTALNAIRVEW